eukprot:CAMPEP_0184973638 /NCGR_PEP_ID=MMETSP1098-20130426/5324_1 /TAXON_ID=89044 /ORGANISM="Spumella elongata, Strain CCAP 955/1" /LENGTH=227 /DNA_ID=CAMNT_0027496099 /DNA_START=31 /DNA_END=711 /DNA_ORIENTATION=+
MATLFHVLGAILACLHVAEATFALNWRLEMTQNNPGGQIDYINELIFYDGDDNVISGIYGVNRIDLNLLYINDGNPSTAFPFFNGLAPQVGDYISLTCALSCEIKKIYMLQSSDSATRIYSMKLEYSTLGITWNEEWPSFNTNFEEQTYTKPVPTPNPTKAPTLAPIPLPSVVPSVIPSMSPSDSPSVNPTESPSVHPSVNPSAAPSVDPTAVPSLMPSVNPSAAPS